VCPLVTFGADNPALGGLLFKFFPVKAVFVIFSIVSVIVEIFGRSHTFFASLPHLVFVIFEKLRVFLLHLRRLSAISVVAAGRKFASEKHFPV
jgi:hypothetical protein